MNGTLEKKSSGKIPPAHSQIAIINGSVPPLVSKWNYRLLMNLGQGSFGTVYSSMAQSGDVVAIKKIKIDPSQTNRELEILESLNSPFCIKLLDYFYSTEVKENNNYNQTISYLNLVTELMPESLGKLIRKQHQINQPLNPFLVKLFIYELFAGISDMHHLGIAHRDIKTDNCLVDTRKGILKIIDFGCAKFLNKDNGPHHSYVASRIYRAPELLLNSTEYDDKVDIWAAGCVISEILLDAIPMFQGCNNEDQLVQIMQILGNPTDEEDKSFQHKLKFPKNVNKICSIEMALPLSTDKNLLALLKRIFVYNPAKRPTADECMRSPYFDELFKEGAKLPNGNPLPHLPRPE